MLSPLSFVFWIIYLILMISSISEDRSRVVVGELVEDMLGRAHLSVFSRARLSELS